jgi:hypothetical protein
MISISLLFPFYLIIEEVKDKNYVVTIVSISNISQSFIMLFFISLIIRIVCIRN